jgi:hypothetical protein
LTYKNIFILDQNALAYCEFTFSVRYFNHGRTFVIVRITAHSFLAKLAPFLEYFFGLLRNRAGQLNVSLLQLFWLANVYSEFARIMKEFVFLHGITSDEIFIYELKLKSLAIV